MAEQVLEAAVAPVAAAVNEEMLKGLVDANEQDDPGEGTPAPATEAAAGDAGATPAAASPPAPAATTTPTPAAAAPATPAAAAATPAATPASAPGTPDKAMQRLQQDLATVLRQQTEINARLATKPPTAAETAAVQKTQRTIDQLRAQIANPDFDANLVDSGVLVKSVLEADATAAANAQTLAEINQKLELLAEQTAADKQRAANPGIDVQAEWDRAVEAAKPYARFGKDAWQQRTQELYDQQLAALKTTNPPPTKPAAAAATPTPTPAATPAATRVGPVVTAGGARLDAPTGAGIAVQQTPTVADDYGKLLDKLWK